VAGDFPLLFPLVAVYREDAVSQDVAHDQVVKNALCICSEPLNACQGITPRLFLSMPYTPSMLK
jgi:hypothetical protein